MRLSRLSAPRPAVPTYLPGYDKANVMPAEYAYTHVNEVGNKVVVIGGGLVGAELALHLASCGKQVTIMHRHEQVKCGANGLHGQAISEQIRIHKVGTAFNTSPVEITDDGVIGKNAGGEALKRRTPLFTPSDSARLRTRRSSSASAHRSSTPSATV